jgi:hypothetical protein
VTGLISRWLAPTVHAREREHMYLSSKYFIFLGETDRCRERDR